MTPLPFDVLWEIVSWLECIRDVRNFRLVCSLWAIAGYPKMAHHMLVLDTISDLKDFNRSMHQHSDRAIYTKRLTLCHGEWPSVLLQADFETHPLLLGGREKWVDSKTDPAIEAAFWGYNNFVSMEASRTPHTDLVSFQETLSSLPSLSTVAVTQLLHQPSRMQRFSQLRKLWMWPSSRGSMQNKIRNILPAFNNFNNITTLEIGGAFQPYCLSFELEHIQNLHIDCMEVPRGLEREFVCFLSAFPKVQNLSITMKRTEEPQLLPIDDLSFPSLHSFHIEGLIITETLMLDFINAQPPGASIALVDAILQRGSWNRIVRRLRARGRLLSVNQDAYNLDLARSRSCHHSLNSCPTCRDTYSSINVS